MVGRAVVVGDPDHARRRRDGLVRRRGYFMRRGLARQLRVVPPLGGNPVRVGDAIDAAQKLAVHRVVQASPDVLIAVDEALPLALQFLVWVKRARDRRAIPVTRRVDVVRVRRARAAHRPVVPQPEPGHEQIVRLPDVRFDPVQAFRSHRDLCAPDVRPGLVVDAPQLRNLKRVQTRAVRNAGDARVDAVEAPGLRVVKQKLEERAGALRVHQGPPRERTPVVRHRDLRRTRGPAFGCHAPALAVADVHQLHLVELVLEGKATLCGFFSRAKGGLNGGAREVHQSGFARWSVERRVCRSRARFERARGFADVPSPWASA